MVSGRTRRVMNGLCHREWLAMGIHHEHMDIWEEGGGVRPGVCFHSPQLEARRVRFRTGGRMCIVSIDNKRIHCNSV